MGDRIVTRRNETRRDFLKTSTGVAAASALGTTWWMTPEAVNAREYLSSSERPILGCIGTGSRWNADGPAAMKFSNCVAVCDVDSRRIDKAEKKVNDIQSKKGRKAKVQRYDDYRKILDRRDIDIVTIVTPDHWHAKIAIEAMKAGKDVYCEKPLTLTIEEGKQICKVARETKRVFQVGTQQRSEMRLRFLTAVAMIRDGRIGDVKKVTCAIGGAPVSKILKKVKPPKELDWERWLGQTPLVDYIEKRCHYEFRWWYEYSGGKMTDWGAHHVDIAQWAIGMDKSVPVSVEGTATHPVKLVNGYPVKDNQYNTASAFKIQCMFPNKVLLEIRHDTKNGITFEGTKGEFFVSRGNMSGKPVDDLKENPLPGDAIAKVYKGKKPAGRNAHMANFIDCVKSREEPISDVFTHHRALTTCHLANIAIRLGRKLNWNPQTQQIVGDQDANAWQSRERRKGYEIEV